MIGKLYFTTHLISVQPQLDPQTSRLGIQLQYFILIMSLPQKNHVKISFYRHTFARNSSIRPRIFATSRNLKILEILFLVTLSELH